MLGIWNQYISHDGSMVLVYMLRFLGYIDGIHASIYSSTMDPMGIYIYIYIYTYIRTILIIYYMMIRKHHEPSVIVLGMSPADME
jgi:hypothetical protein